MASRQRFRGIQLNEQGIEALKSGIEAKLQDGIPAKKLTRVSVAEILDLSVGTATKLLEGKKVDRASAELGLRRVGLKLEPYFVVVELDRAQNQFDRAEPETDVNLPIADPPETHRKGAQSNRVSAAAYIALAAALVLGCGVILFPRKSELRQATEAFQSGDYAKAERIAAAIQQTAIKSESSAYLSDHYLVKGELAGKNGDYAEAERCYKVCIDIWGGLGQTKRLPPFYEQLGESQLKLLKFEESRKSFLKSLSGFRETGDPVGCVTAMRGLGSALFEMGKLDEALEWFDEALVLLKKSEAGKAKIDIEKDVVARRALTIASLKHSPAAIADLKTCLDHWKDKGHRRWMATTYLQLARAYRELNQAAESQSSASESYMLYVSEGDFAGAKRANELCSNPR